MSKRFHLGTDWIRRKVLSNVRLCDTIGSYRSLKVGDSYMEEGGLFLSISGSVRSLFLTIVLTASAIIRTAE